VISDKDPHFTSK
jgi:hypothetical protein